jgi:hypothetical protein
MRDPMETSYRPYVDQGRTTWGSLSDLGPNHVSTLARYWLSRSFVAIMTLALIVGAWLEPESLVHELFDKSGLWGWRVAGLVCATCVLCTLEVVWNDLLPAHRSMKFVKRRRHLFYLAIGVGNAACAFMFVDLSGGLYRGVMLPYTVLAAYSFIVAFLDLFQRHRAPQT